MSILHEASLLVSGDRQQDYGPPTESFYRIAALWSILLNHKVSPVDVARCMIALKLSRSLTSHKRDNWVDAAAYAELANQLQP